MASGGALKPNKSEEYYMKLKESLVSQFCLGNWLRQRREIIAVSDTTMYITNGQRDALDPKKMNERMVCEIKAPVCRAANMGQGTQVAGDNYEIVKIKG
ncbi:hypothetical protein TKK_0008038 [Trichogramma kaykai]